MNRSGLALQELRDHHHQGENQIIVIHDDLDLEPGILRIRPRGGHGGHKGIKSILEHVGDMAFIRVRIGIGRPHHETVHEVSSSREAIVDYVLQPFDDEELPIMNDVLDRAADAIELILSGQLEAAMNQYNRREVQRSASTGAL
jgi:PTH1 family peptidyl-tRNA hydrolase